MPEKKTYPGAGVVAFLEKVEDILLICLLLSMILLAVSQIVLRNYPKLFYFLFPDLTIVNISIPWADNLIRILVLWIGLIGAMIASRSNKHISIDIISRYLSDKAKRFSTLAVALFTATICGLMAYYSFVFVRMEYQDGMTVFGKLPSWICETVIPFAFAVITLRYIVLAVSSLIRIFRQEPS